MKWLIVLSVVVASAAAATVPPAGPVGYHQREGIALATAARAAEESAVSSGRIFNGSPAALGQFPYFGGLVIPLTSGATSACGSALLTSTRLLTAAHCWWDGWNQAEQFTVVLGSVWLFSGGTRIDTTAVDMHAGWQPQTLSFAHDIAVISIPGVAFSNTISPVARASGAANYAGAQAQAIGIGMTGQGVPITVNQFLAHTSVPVLTNAQCAQSYGAAVTDYILCTGAGAGNSNICSGDSGGPITVGNVLVGVVSFGNGGGAGCEGGLPAGHSRVSAYQAWIDARL